ncbi:UNVERIFIED_CONTAM: hypothetical protein FKN15_075502 [Acipenser sinensis]
MGGASHLTCRVALLLCLSITASTQSQLFHDSDRFDGVRVRKITIASPVLGDAFQGTYPGIDQNGSAFSTRDRDNDGCNPCVFGDIAMMSCSELQGGSGWWFSRCGSANLNGDWHPRGDNIGWSSGVYWKSWKGPAPYSLRASVMKVKAL